MNFVIVANWNFREPIFTLNDVDLGRLTVSYQLGE